MNRYLEVDEGGTVVNIAVWDGQSNYAPAGVTLLPCSDHPGVEIGWKLSEGQWHPAKMPVPHSVTMRQARLALLNAGLLETVEAAINSIDNQAAKIEWQFSQTVNRDSQWVSQVAGSIGLGDEDVDDLFRAADAL